MAKWKRCLTVAVNVKLHSCPTLVSWLLPTKSCCSQEQSRLEAVSHSLSPLYWHDDVLCQTQRSVTWSVSSVLAWQCAMPTIKQLCTDMTMCYAKHEAALYWHDTVLYQTQWQCAIPNEKQLCTDMTMCCTKHKAALNWHDNVLYQTQSSVS